MVDNALVYGLPGIRMATGTTPTGTIIVTNRLLVGGLSIYGEKGTRSHLKAIGSGRILDIAATRLLTFDDLILDGNNTATNLVRIDNSTLLSFNRNFFYQCPGVMIQEVGVQNYSHGFRHNLFSLFGDAAIAMEATSVTDQTIEGNVFDASTLYRHSSTGVRLMYGAEGVSITKNVFQSLNIGVDNRGSIYGSNFKNDIYQNYFELCPTASIRLAADGQITGLSIRDNFFNTQYTSNMWAVIDGGIPSQVYGFDYHGNIHYPDASKALNVTNLAGTGWTISSAATDWAIDYAIPTNYPSLFQFGNQSARSVLVTNFSSVSSGSTNMQIVMFRLPDYLVVNPTDGDSAVTLAGTMHHGSKLQIKNISTNNMVFSGYPLQRNINEEFSYLNGTWYRDVGPYLLNTGGQLNGDLFVNGQLSVVSNTLFYAGVTINGVLQNPSGFVTYGTVLGTNMIVFGANAGSILSLRKGSTDYVLVGTNGATRFLTPIDLPAASGTLNYVAGWNVDPNANSARLLSTAAGATGRSMIGAATAPDGRSLLGLGNSATRDVGTSSVQVASGNHTHTEFDTIGTSSNSMVSHVAAADPHPGYVLESSGVSTNQTLFGDVGIELGSDLSSGGSHRALVRDASTGKMRTMTGSYFKGWLDIRAADISDAGAKGRLLLQASTTANALDQLGTGRAGGASLFLREDGTWASPPTGAPGTNGIADAPNDGTAYVRKSAGWTGLALGDMSGLTSWGRSWADTVSSASAARTSMELTGGSPATIDSPATHVSRVNSTGSGAARHRNNFIAGTGIGLALTDDSVSDEADITVSLADGDRGDYTVSSGTATIDSGAVSYSKIQSVTASRLLGRGDSGAGAPQELTAGAGLAISGTTVSVDPSTFISGQVLYVAAEEVSLSGTDFTDESWHNVAGTAKTGTSKTIAAGSLGSGTVLKIEMAGEFQYEDAAVMDLRVTIGGLTMTFDWNEVYVEDADSASPWNAVVYVTVKTSGASATVRSSGYLDWTTLTSFQPNVNYQFKCKATQSGTLDTTGSNLIGVDFYGTDSAGPQFNAFTLNQVIVTRL